MSSRASQVIGGYSRSSGMDEEERKSGLREKSEGKVNVRDDDDWTRGSTFARVHGPLGVLGQIKVE